jgi:hypothetical protein
MNTKFKDFLFYSSCKNVYKNAMSLIKFLLWLFCGIVLFCAIVFLFYVVLHEPIYRSFDIRKYKRFCSSLDKLKTGDLILCRNFRMGWLYRGIWGCQITHVGLLHRCIHTGRLYVFEAVEGIHYTLLEDMQFTYSGDIFVRQLKTPLNEEQLQWTQRIIDKLYKGANKSPTTRCLAINDPKMPNPVRAYVSNRLEDRDDPFQLNRTGETKTKSVCSCVASHLFQMHDNQIGSYAIVCTDVVYIMLQKWGILSATETRRCILPDWIAFESEEINRSYGEMLILKDYNMETERLQVENNDSAKIIINDITARH